MRVLLTVVLAIGLCACVAEGQCPLNLGAEQIVQAGGADLVVLGYSVPELVDWNEDDLADLVVGEGGGSINGKVRVYLNVGTALEPAFTTYFYVQANGADLVETPGNCLGAFPRVVYWDGDERKDLLVGLGNGKVKIYLNNGTDAAPTFAAGVLLQVGATGSKVDINVLGRATPCAVDWNNDARKDLVVGGVDGHVHIYLNQGTDTAPDFQADLLAQSGGAALSVPSMRASPVVCELSADGKKDLLTGNTNGELLLYTNTGTDAAPDFAGYTAVTANGVAIDLPGTPRSRPFVCDWTGDGLPDVLIGSGDGKVHLYQSLFRVGDMDCSGRVDFGDIDYIVAAIPDNEADWAALYAARHGGDSPRCPFLVCDANGDGHVNFADIDPFVELLAG